MYTLNLIHDEPPLITGHLKLGGANPRGQTIEVSSYYLLEDGQPCIPVMGEFHFSRFDQRYWEDELRKIKAGGVQIVATYVFWNHVEEDEGVFDWSGNNNLRQFVTLCGQVGLRAIVRLGPFAHGEARNGGFPDWLYGRPMQLRSNDPRYLAYAKRLYKQIAAQISGLLFKDGGAVIGVQLENEYMHAGAPWETTFKQGTEWVSSSREGAAHMLALKQLALDAGLDVPLYTCTGWLHSPVPDGDMLPMQGGYAFTPWSPDPAYVQPPTREFLFRSRHLAPVLNGDPTYDAARYPYVCCEIGGGIQDTYYHRNLVPSAAVEGLVLMNLAGGANVIGTYMYHGGTNPIGKHAYMNEFTVPRRSYDFQAPLREYGQATQSYRALRLIHQFLQDFGDLLAPMTVVLPDDAATITPEDTTSLRWSVRAKEGAGFVFLNNYQDHVETQDISGVQFALQSTFETMTFPQSEPLTLAKNTSAILPVGIRLNGIRLRYATTQLFARLGDDYFFFAPDGMVSEYSFGAIRLLQGNKIQRDGDEGYIRVTPGTDSRFHLMSVKGEFVNIFTLTRDQAEHAAKQTLWGEERLIISEGTLIKGGEKSEGESFLFSALPNRELLVYPPVEGAEMNGAFSRHAVGVPAQPIRLQIEQIDAARAVVKLPPNLLDGLNDVLLQVDYVGDIGNCFINGVLMADDFYNGDVWEIGLKQFVDPAAEVELYIMITPIKQNAGVLKLIPTGMAFRPDDGDQGVAEIRGIYGKLEYKIPLGKI